jgi:drug/metabolite transporter (DMT)-like permease
VLLLLGLLKGEPAGFHFEQVTASSIWAWIYLVGAGSLIGYTAYSWLLIVSTPARVATYGYVNPIIAVLLGCTLGREAYSPELITASVMVFLSVLLIVRGSAKKSGLPIAKAPATEAS